MADERHAAAAVGFIVGTEEPPVRRGHAEQAKNVTRHVRAGDAVGRASRFAHRHRRRRVRRHVDVDEGRFPVCVVQHRHAAMLTGGVGGADVKHPIRVCDRQATEEVGVRDRERHAAHADAQCERGDDDGAEPGVTCRQSHGKPNVADQVVHPSCPARVPAVFLDLIEAAELEPRTSNRFCRRQALGCEIGNQPVEVIA